MTNKKKIDIEIEDKIIELLTLCEIDSTDKNLRGVLAYLKLLYAGTVIKRGFGGK